MSKLLSELDTFFYQKALKVFKAMKTDKDLKKMGVDDIIIVETRRDLAVQMAYYSRGRMEIEDVKKMYKSAGLYEISDEEAKTKNTWTLESKHLNGEAVDFAPIKNKAVWWTAPTEVWQRMGEIGEECGLLWGGRWAPPDYPHFQQ